MSLWDYGAGVFKKELMIDAVVIGPYTAIIFLIPIGKWEQNLMQIGVYAASEFIVWDLIQPNIAVQFGEANTFTDPDMCPMCKVGIDAQRIIGYKRLRSKELTVVYRCPRHDCGRLFMADFKQFTSGKYDVHYELKGVFPFSFRKKEFGSNILSLSPMFETIYNEALRAEGLGLTNICGMGYRKSLEFLVKDYLIKVGEVDEPEIKLTSLGKCISQHVQNDRIKDMAQRAAWLGNDETHYQRLWEDKDVDDLKALIGLVLHFIESELLYQHYVTDMEKPKK